MRLGACSAGVPLANLRLGIRTKIAGGTPALLNQQRAATIGLILNATFMRR